MDNKNEMQKVMDMTMGVFDADEGNWGTINGTHVLIGEGGEVKSGPAGLKGKTMSKAKTAAKTNGGEEKMTSSHKKALAHVIKKDLYLDDLDYKNADSLDFWDNDRDTLSVGTLKDALSKAYKAGVEQAKKRRNSISAAQIEKNVAKQSKSWLGFDLDYRGRDGYDFWENDRGSFSVYSLQSALEHMYGQGYSSGDHHNN